MYGMTPWKDEVVQYPYRYKETQNSDGTVEHEPSPGTVMQQGTPQSATNFNHIKEQSLIQKQPSKSEGCFCIYARKAHNIRLSGLFLFSGDLVD